MIENDNFIVKASFSFTTRAMLQYKPYVQTYRRGGWPVTERDLSWNWNPKYQWTVHNRKYALESSNKLN